MTNLINEKSTYLSRPWRDYGCAAFIGNKIIGNLYKEGFNKWDGTNRDKTARFFEYTENTNTSDRPDWVHQLTKEKSKEYVRDFLTYIQYELWAK